MGEWKKRKILNQPLFTWVEVGGFLVIGVALAIIFLALVNIKPKAKKIPPVPIPISASVSDFKSRRGTFGRQEYIVSTQKSVDDGSRKFFPPAGCPDLLVVDLKHQITETERLREKIAILDGIASAEVYMYKVIVYRTCVSVPGFPQLWTWEEIWAEASPVLEAYFQTQK